MYFSKGTTSSSEGDLVRAREGEKVNLLTDLFSIFCHSVSSEFCFDLGDKFRLRASGNEGEKKEGNASLVVTGCGFCLLVFENFFLMISTVGGVMPLGKHFCPIEFFSNSW
jgi:hypothetical protein